MAVVARAGNGSLTLHYCELCHAALRSRHTRYFAFSMAASIMMGTSVGLSLLIHREQFMSWAPLWALLTLTVCGASVAFFGYVARAAPELEIEKSGAATVWLRASPGSSAIQAALGTLTRQRETHRPPPISRGAALLGLAPLFGALLPLAVSFAFLRVELIVLEPELDGVFLVDQRWVSETHAVRSEFPHAGLHLKLMAGERDLSIVGQDGSLRLETRAWLEPGQSYVFGRLPAGLCLYRQTELNGPAPEHLLEKLEGGPLFEISGPVQFWFEEPPSAEAASTRGGTANALRLLPCGSR